MKYLKTFEKLLKPELDDIISQIKEYVEDATYDDDDTFDDIEECPFAKEMAILHQQDYVDEIYDSMSYRDDSYTMYNIKSDEFKKIYNDLLIEAREKILKYILKDPSLYSKWNVDYEDLEIPDWIKTQSKYNL